MLKKIKNIFHYNFKNMLFFELVFKLATLIIFSPLFLKLFNLIMNVTNYHYLTKENFLSFLLNPITLIMLFILFVFITIYSLFDIGVIITLIDSSYHEKNIKLMDAVKWSLKQSLKVFQPQNILIIFLVIFLIPFLHIGIGTNLITSIKIPEFIMDFIKANYSLLIFYVFIIVALMIVLLKWLYSFHYYFLEQCSFKEAIKKSKNLSQGKHIRDLLTIGLTQFSLMVIYLLFVVIEIIIMVLINKIFNQVDLLNSFLITITWVVIMLSFLIFAILSSVISYTILSVLFYQHKGNIEESIKPNTFIEAVDKKKKGKLIKVMIMVLILIPLTYVTHLIIEGKFNLNIEYIRAMEVTAHRGASVIYPENTMASFKGAKQLGSDWIELDVQQTKDNYIIVSHDTNFNRTANVNLNTWDMTLDEVQKLDVGSFKSTKFKGEKVPLLEEVIKWAKDNDMKLNIELKPTGREIDFEKQVASLITKYNFASNCVVTSQVYDVLEAFKKVNSNITTVYVTAFAYGDVTKLTAANYFSVEATSITKSMVSSIHNAGKQIYAWTVNTKESINKMIDLNVDNIITDNPTLAKKLIYSSKSSNIIIEIIKGVDKLF